MNIGPNAQAVVKNLAGRPAEIIARESDAVQATFRALFNGAYTPGKTDARGAIECGSEDAAKGWPGAWVRLQKLELVAFNLQPIQGRIIMAEQSMAAHSIVHWQITPDGWKVRMDDVAWMAEFLAADVADRSTKQ